MRHLRLNAWRGPGRRVRIDSPVRASWMAVICLATLAPAFAQSPKPMTTIDSAAFNQDADGARVVLSADGPLLYTSYEPRLDLLVVDLTGASVSATFAAPAVTGTLVTDIKVEPINELGHLQTRLSIRHTEGLKYEISSQGRALAIAFEAPGVAADPVSAQPTTAAEPPAPVAPVPVSPAPEVPGRRLSPRLKPEMFRPARSRARLSGSKSRAPARTFRSLLLATAFFRRTISSFKIRRDSSSISPA